MLVHCTQTTVPEDRTYLIGELAEKFEVSLRTIRFYEQRGLISPKRTDPHTRVFANEDVDRLGFIVTCRRLGLTVDAIADLLVERDRLAEDAFETVLADALTAHRDTLEAEIADRRNQHSYVTTWLEELGRRD